MDQKLAVLFMPDDMTLTKEQAPLMLRPILFCPILTWMVEELMGRGIERFFVVSDKRAHDMMRPYVPENADVVYVDGARHGEELLTLLKGEKGSVLIVNGAVLPVGVFSGGAVYSADAKECCKVLKEIMEEPEALRRAILPRIKDGAVVFDGLMLDSSRYDCIKIIACGSSYHVGMVGKYNLEKLVHIPVEVVLASEIGRASCWERV